MKKFFSLAWLLGIFLLLFTAGVSCAKEEVSASLGKEFTLPVGKTANIVGENVKIKFVRVEADSRCPTGVQCIWAGEAYSRLYVTYNGSTSDIILTQSGSSTGTENLLGFYTVSFRLEPYPQSGKTIKDSDYKLVMTITK